MKPVSCQTYVKPSMVAACYKKQQAFLADSQVFYNICLFLSIIYNQTVNTAFNSSLAKPKNILLQPHVSASRPDRIRSLVFALTYSEVKADFFTLKCLQDGYNFEQSKHIVWLSFQGMLLLAKFYVAIINFKFACFFGC